ncbi:primosomal protein N' [Caenispirillum bisanense]|uniref:primosomal protein N' n=1 Tax=Caenispirillum bisanense TaxID=414052 RepID=UPI0031D5118A
MTRPPATPAPAAPAEDGAPARFAAGSRVGVLLPLPLGGVYDYRVPLVGTDGPVVEGQAVEVPLGKRREIGVVWGPGTGEVPDAKVKDVLRAFPAPPLPAVTRRFVDWVAAYTLSAPGAVLRMAVSVPQALEEARPLTVYGLRDPARPPDLEAMGIKATRARLAVLQAGAELPPLPAAELAREAGVSDGVVRGLAEAGVLVPSQVQPLLAPDRPDPDHPGPQLSPGQREIADDLCRRVRQPAFSVALLEGVTGSGKTEVYFEAVAEALRAGRQVLVLVPEISLTGQWLARFRRRFGASPLEWHSELTAARRRDTWRAVADGRAAVVVGARSALFLPYPDLGLIVVDEEHEQAFKQEEGVPYHARDMAVVRAQLGAIPVVLASATPSLETAINAEAGRYDRLHLPDRHAGAEMPAVTVVDMRRYPPEKGDWGRSWLAPPVVEAVTETLAKGEQVLLFLNRRGYAPLTLCRTCGYRIQCPNCTAWLVEHRLAKRLVCHHCGHSAPLPAECPGCGAEDSLAACGPGVERLAEEVEGRWPQARSVVVASDTLGGPSAVAAMMQRIADHEVDLLIGTQVLAKGHHFPQLTLVGVVDSDLGLSGGDLRAAERTWQLLTQVAGRAGRGEKPGRVMLQTYQPEHPVLQALATGDADSFLAAETEGRRAASMPPFGRLAAVIVSGEDEAAVDAVCRALAQHAPRDPAVEVLGPAPAPLALLRGRHRRRFLVKTPRGMRIQPVMRGWLTKVRVPHAVRVQVDIDPYSFL